MKNLIAIIDPYSSGKNLAKYAKEMGYQVLSITSNKDFSCDYSDNVIFYDNHKSLLSILKSEYTNIIALIPGVEYVVPLVSKLSEELKLPHLDKEVAVSVRYKNIMRDLLNKNNIQIPKYSVISDENQFLTESKKIGYPVVIKPINLSGSLGVKKLYNDIEVSNYWKKNCLNKLSDLNIISDDNYLVEEYINGDEYSVEGYINDDINIISITKKLLSDEPYFIEIGHIVNLKINNTLRGEIEKYIKNVINSLNINFGIFHAEVKVNENGIFLMEIGCRLPGDNIPDLILNSFGINLYKIMINIHVGKKNIEVLRTKDLITGIYYFYNPNINYYTEIKNKDSLIDSDIFIKYEIKNGLKSLINKTYDSEARIGYCMFEASSEADMINKLNTAKNIHFL